MEIHLFWTLICVFLTIFNNVKLCVCESESALKNPRIVIIGAGAAGIAASSKLLENGFNNVTILEAGNRIGGRVYTTKLGEYLVDLGGQWVHGEQGNVAFELAYPHNLIKKSENEAFDIEQEYLDSKGNRLNDELANNISTFYFQYINDHNFENDTTYESIGEYIEKLFDEVFKNNKEILKDRKKFLHQLEVFTTGNDPGDNWYNISTLGSKEYKLCSGDQTITWKTRGYSTILELLMKRYPDPIKELPVLNNTIFNSEVTIVNYLNETNEAPILITTAQGEIYKADHVIVTVSLGVLKEKYQSFFNPPLPDYKIETIQGLGFGNAGKVYLLFENPFWIVNKTNEGKFLHFTFVWNDDDRKIVESNPEKIWMLGLSGAMTVDQKPNLLELWISGRYSKEMEKVNEAKIFNQSVEVLNRFLGKMYNVTQPIAMMRTQWFTNPHFRGTYSYRSVESQRRKVYSEMLEKPLDLENLLILFAGEATSKHRFSTVDGAIGSGWKAADRLINLYKKKNV